MKRYFCLFLAAFALIGCCSMFLIRPVSAAESDRPIITNDYSGEISGWYRYECTGRNGEHTVSFSGDCLFPFELTMSALTALDCGSPVPQGNFSFNFDSGTEYCFVFFDSDLVDHFDTSCFGAYVYSCSFFSDVYSVFDCYLGIPNGSYLYFLPGSTINISWPEMQLIPVDPASLNASPGIYHSIENLITQAFYGDGEITGWQELVATTLATAALVFMFALPFLVVFFVIRLVVPSR